MKKSIIIILFLFTVTFSYGQQETLAIFKITEATENGDDVTKDYINSGGYIVFFTEPDGTFYMSNVRPEKDSQSFGKLSPIKYDKPKENNNRIFLYTWNYKNNYNGNSGTATVELFKIYKPQGGITYECKIATDKLIFFNV
ncbi:hypothetical protein FPK15_contig00008-0008 [Flavobacterium psychrophilum]|uniref:hypothetical protein n=1 Tax=Flavobacterium psychrophilum TaxID=96345 RepID=UPI00073EF622|nr:hypothetical protein [Flavobacterium psychrophilum]GAQ48287.1 hypothetical protein FPK15_contig00008-0008 [Flavobacterium psychrophilum]